ncbi:hypothetical protein WMY93_028399 [Mugilogobius chulae]|uniref:EXPERA domain-containing protein n=1 Tax=Mugilogobius chulae TaxID=88201 RepID=A0AAW0MQ48_9GOBI
MTRSRAARACLSLSNGIAPSLTRHFLHFGPSQTLQTHFGPDPDPPDSLRTRPRPSRLTSDQTQTLQTHFGPDPDPPDSLRTRPRPSRLTSDQTQTLQTHFGPDPDFRLSQNSSKMSLRVLEIVFFLYFASHVPITLLIDLQALLPAHVYPQQLQDVLHWYAAEFKDPMVLDPPEWFKSFIFCEALVQLPFFPIAAYAFLKGGCSWIRTPASSTHHVATTLIPILAHILFFRFPLEPHAGPQTARERWLLVSIYAPYLLVPVLLLLTMLFSKTYNPTTATKPRDQLQLRLKKNERK